MSTLSAPTIFCLTSARLMKELSPLLPPVARSRWLPDPAALLRTLAAHENVIAGLIEATPSAAETLVTFRDRSPHTRRIIVADACDLQMVRTMLETGLATELIYRPLDADTVSRALGVKPAATRPQRPARPAGSRG